MVATPETCRVNGRQSRGPTTERGKAIASLNSTKHGLLSQKPPLLATEDLESFEGLMQGLVDCYQPSTPVEWHLVQQVAMAMLRQHRLWATEAGLANQAMLQLERQAKYPANPSLISTLGTDRGKEPHDASVWKNERYVACELRNAVEQWLDGLPKRGQKQWVQSQLGREAVAQLQEQLDRFMRKLPLELVPPQESEEFKSTLFATLLYSTSILKIYLDHGAVVESFRRIAEGIIDRCQRRVDEIEDILVD